jgi:hypothetical protein
MFVRSAFDRRVKRNVRKSSIFKFEPVRESLLQGAAVDVERFTDRLAVRLFKTILITVRRGNAHSAATTSALHRQEVPRTDLLRRIHRRTWRTNRDTFALLLDRSAASKIAHVRDWMRNHRAPDTHQPQRRTEIACMKCCNVQRGERFFQAP